MLGGVCKSDLSLRGVSEIIPKINQFLQPKNSQLQLIPPNKLLHVFWSTFFYQTIMQNGDNQMHFPIIVTHDRKLVHIVVCFYGIIHF
jgi:hypothetical protein